MGHSDIEVSRMQEKCRSYENEVGRIRSVHKAEADKLKLRISTLEKVLRSVDSLVTTVVDALHHLSLQSLESLEAIASNTSTFHFEPFASSSKRRLT